MTVNVGDIVRVANTDAYQAAFARKIRDRDAVVLKVGGDGLYKGSARVRFLKRNGRGKEFEERIRMTDLVPREGGGVE